MTANDAEPIIQAFTGAVSAITIAGESTQHVIDGVVPRAIVQPADIRELSRALEAAQAGDLAVAPRGGATRTALGNAPGRLDAIMDLSRLDGVLSHNPADLTATVQAGITLTGLQEILAEHGQFLALDPPLPDRATVGGALAVGVGGPLKWQYGSPRDVVIGMTVVQADGTVTKSGGQVVKNVSGYDMPRLHVGGLGTLGVIAEVSFKLTPLPDCQATLVAAFDAAGPCLSAALGVFRSDVLPLSLVSFDAAANERMGAVQGDSRGFLAVRLGGRPRTLERLIRESQSMCQRHGPSSVEVMSDAESATLWRRLADFGWDEETTPVLGCRASVPPSGVPEVVETVESWEVPAALRPAIVSHPAHGTVLAGWFSDGDAYSGADVTLLARRFLDAVHAAGGTLVIEHCPTEVKSGLDVWDDPGPSVAIMRRLKEQYDPKRILNPGRYVGGI